ncbi:MAG: hypothetical protein K0V04_38300 [Deltaproteobacteria bacterium]|nr:hypothetical protein [Deltaproteobacteria bacterium]
MSAVPLGLSLLGSGATGSTVAVAPLVGETDDAQLQRSVIEGLRARGLQVDELGCRSYRDPSTCPQSLHRRWRAHPDSHRFFVQGRVEPRSDGHVVHLEVLERGTDQPVATLHARFVSSDQILPIVFPVAVAEAIETRIEPPAPPGPDELRVLTQLDEPPATAVGEAPQVEEPAPPRPQLQGHAHAPSTPEVIEALQGEVDQDIDLRRDFGAVCRSGRRRHRSSRDDPRDLRPRCSAGPVLGYIRPRTWVTGTLMVASAIASGVAFRVRRQGEFSSDTENKLGGWGKAMAATSGVLGVGSITLVIGDRWQARRHLRDERWFARSDTATR